MNSCNKNNKTCASFLMMGICLAIFSLSPLGTYLEEELGLALLFKLRGPVSPPKNVIIVSIDESSANILHLPDNPEKWPRSYYAELINKINQQSPALIAFNMTFEENRAIENDQLLAQTISDANNVVLSNYLKRQTIQSNGSFNAFKFERIINSIPLIEDASLASAPFLLPKTSTTVKQFWVFKNSAGDLATFPTTIFQQYLAKQVSSEIKQFLHQLKLEYQKPFSTKPNQYLNNEIDFQKIKQKLLNNPQTINKLQQAIILSEISIAKKNLLNTWLSLLNQPNSLYFNYYGKAETITTIPFYQALVSNILNPDLFKNKIVLVGYSKTIEPEKSSGLYTAFSEIDDDTTSPIEIAATAVANLLENSWIKPLSAINQLLLIIIWSTILSAISRLFSYKQTISLLFILTIGYLIIAYMQFSEKSIWIPIFFPIIIQIPLMISLISFVYFLRGKQEHRNMHQAFSLYVPDDVVSSISQQANNTKTMNLFGERVQGVCMATDAGQFTSLSESMKAEELHHLINQYYAVMFPLVKRNQGIISDVIGDAMFAIWNESGQQLKSRSSACLAALEIKNAVESFNKSQPSPLYTRLGLNFGDFHLGNVGAADHYEYRAVGDTVNTATRIEGLNKLLGTQILVSADVIEELPHLLTREMGFFILKGKTQPVHIYELIGTTAMQDPLLQNLITEFSVALRLFKKQKWTKALAKWIGIEQLYPQDGPTHFYIDYLKHNLHRLQNKKATESQETIITIGNITTPLLLDK